MVHIRCTAHKSTGGHITIGQLAPRSTLQQQEETVEPQRLESVVPQQEESAEPQQKEELAKPQHEEDVSTASVIAMTRLTTPR
jgi:hypothetical protein